MKYYGELKIIRKGLKLECQDIAEFLGVTRQTIHNVENQNKKDLSPLLIAYNVKIKQLIKERFEKIEESIKEKEEEIKLLKSLQ